MGNWKFDFDTYEFAGLIAPGSVVVLAILLLQPWLFHFADAATLIAVAIIGSYIVGHLVAAVGNLGEKKVFPILGVSSLQYVPLSDWRSPKRGYLSKSQEPKLRKLLAKMLKDDRDHEQQLEEQQLEEYEQQLDEQQLDEQQPDEQQLRQQQRRQQRRMLVKRMYLVVSDNKGHAERLDTFSGLISLSRGLTISFLFAFVLCLIARQYVAGLFCIAASYLALYRMGRFSDAYARELVQQFLLISSRVTPTQPTPAREDSR